MVWGTISYNTTLNKHQPLDESPVSGLHNLLLAFKKKGFPLLYKLTPSGLDHASVCDDLGVRMSH